MNEPIFSSLIAFSVAILWGLNSVFVKKGMKGQDPLMGMFVRTLVTFPILLTIASFVWGIKKIKIYFSAEFFPLIILTSVLIVVGDGIFLYTLKNYDVSQILPIASVYPLFTTIILILTGVESVSSQVIMGTIVIVLGVAIVTGSKGRADFSFTTIVYGLSIGICWGSSIFFVRKILDDPSTDALSLTGVRTLFMGIFALLLYYSRLFRVETDMGLEEKSLKPLLYLSLSGIVGWVLGATLFFYAVQNIGAAIPTPISSTNPIFASLIGVYLGIEKVNIWQFIGILFTVTGTIIIIL